MGKLVQAECFVRFPHTVQVGAPDTDGHAQVHMLWSFSLHQVGFAHGFEAKVVEQEISGEVEHIVEFIGVRINDVPHIARDVLVFEGFVDGSNISIGLFLEIADQNTGCELGVPRMFCGQSN